MLGNRVDLGMVRSWDNIGENFTQEVVGFGTNVLRNYVMYDL